LCGISIPLH